MIVGREARADPTNPDVERTCVGKNAADRSGGARQQFEVVFLVEEVQSHVALRLLDPHSFRSHDTVGVLAAKAFVRLRHKLSRSLLIRCGDNNTGF